MMSFINFSENLAKEKRMLISQISTLDSFMQNNDSAILELLTKDISFGHSNGWVQTYNDFQNDIESKKVEYKVVKGEDSPTIKIIANVANVRRTIEVKGFYNEELFEIRLSVLEIWLRQKINWKLWSRQSTSIKI